MSSPASTTLRCPVCGASTEPYHEHPEADLHRCVRCAHCFADQASLRTPVTYDEAYGDEAHKNWFNNPNLRLFEYVERQIRSRQGRRVLDVGCGRGAFLGFLAERHPDWRLTGIEVTAFEPPPGVELVVGDFDEVELTEPFDVVVSLAVVEHVPDPRSFVRRAVAAARPGGTVVLMTVNTDSVLYATARMLRRLGISGPFEQLYSSHHLHHFNTRSFRELVEGCGLVVEARHEGHIPAAAIDFPSRGPLLDGVRKAGALGTFALGRMTGRCYLQTLVARVPT